MPRECEKWYKKTTIRISGDVDNDSQSDCHSDSNSCAPEVMVSDARVFRMNKNSANKNKELNNY
jgi:hypothetical protein